MFKKQKPKAIVISVSLFAFNIEHNCSIKERQRQTNSEWIEEPTQKVNE